MEMIVTSHFFGDPPIQTFSCKDPILKVKQGGVGEGAFTPTKWLQSGHIETNSCNLCLRETLSSLLGAVYS